MDRNERRDALRESRAVRGGDACHGERTSLCRSPHGRLRRRVELMRSGTLRKAGMLQVRSAARDAAGGSPVIWQDFARVRFMIVTDSGRELDSAGNTRSV